MSTDERDNQPRPPVPGERNILITSALPYVNNVPHLGNVVGSVLSGDVFSRYCRLRGYNCMYICGSDEYGTATETKAMLEKVSPRDICDKYHDVHFRGYQWFDIDFDSYGRTSTAKQTEISQRIFNDCHKNGFIFPQEIEQLYCEKCERFLADRFIEGTCPLCGYEEARGDQCDKCSKLINAVELKQSRCGLCKTEPKPRKSTHLFLDLPKIEPELKNLIDKRLNDAGCKWSTTAKSIVRSWLKEGLKPRCITRDLKWGTPVPLEGFTDKVFYVWFDAPIGYLSITALFTDDWEKWWLNPENVELFQFMGKDNAAFHGVIFPSTQLASRENFTIVNQLIAVEHLNYNNSKFSKSRGVGIFCDNMETTGIDSDLFRFYLMYIRPETQDTNFSWLDLMNKCNSELLNNLGNFMNRVIIFINKNFASKVPEIIHHEDDDELIDALNKEIESYVDLFEVVSIRDALRVLLNIGRLGNGYLQKNKPWVLLKGSDDEKKRAASVLGLSIQIVVVLALLMKPFLPKTHKKICEQLKYYGKHYPEKKFVHLLETGHTIGDGSPLFRKISDKEIAELEKRFPSSTE